MLGDLLQEKERIVEEVNRAVNIMWPQYIFVDIWQELAASHSLCQWSKFGYNGAV
jgi:hypothetical protein